MAEAEDVLTDAARHATGFVQDLWRRHRAAPAGPAPPRLADLARRLELLLVAAFGHGMPLRLAQAPLPPTWLARWLKRPPIPWQSRAVPATDGTTVWLPPARPGATEDEALTAWRVHALRQAMRCVRGSAAVWAALPSPSLRDAFLLLEAEAADADLAARLPGMAPALQQQRLDALKRRPPLRAFAPAVRPLEELVRGRMADADNGAAAGPPAAVADRAGAWLARLRVADNVAWLWHDGWTGELKPPPPVLRAPRGAADDADESLERLPPRSARLARRPDVREAGEEEDDRGPGAWMVQTAQPQEKAEDPMGLQRPTDRDEQTASDDFADAVSELEQARLVSTPGAPREVLLSDDPPPPRSRNAASGRAAPSGRALRYPEWDWQAGGYREPGATVWLRPPADGPAGWIERTLAERSTMLHEIRRRFELLRARRVRLRRQLDGDAVDLDAWCEARADFLAGRPLSQHLYLRDHRARRDLAILLLVDVSGSTDAWISPGRRIIDVEREALLLVCLALEGLAEPYCVQAFSGEGPQGVIVRPILDFGERYGPAVARRIAGLEPEHYTRAGAALRHATATLVRQAATHRLLLLLSDGKPNDVDAYEGRYGVEDMRQAVHEARLQGLTPFCLTIDRQAADYLPAIFGPHHFALLPHPDRLPAVLLDWLRRLVSR